MLTEMHITPARARGGLLMRMAVNVAVVAIAIGCIVALAAWSGVGLRELADRLMAVPIYLVGALVLLSMASFALSARKWQLVLCAISPEIERKMAYGFFFACTAVSAFLSQLMTAYLSSVLVRSWAARRYHGITLGKGAASSVFEQVFDVVVLGVMFVPALVVWSQSGTVAHWGLATGAAVLAGAGLLLIVNRTLLTSRLFAIVRKRLNLGSHDDRDRGDKVAVGAPLILQLYALSLLRFVILMARIPLIIVALGFPVGLWDGAQGFAIVQATQLVSFIPGNLGLQEWTWVGVLALRGYAVETGTAFAISLRLVSMVAIAVAAALALLPLLRPRRNAI